MQSSLLILCVVLRSVLLRLTITISQCMCNHPIPSPRQSRSWSPRRRGPSSDNSVAHVRPRRFRPCKWDRQPFRRGRRCRRSTVERIVSPQCCFDLWRIKTRTMTAPFRVRRFASKKYVRFPGLSASMKTKSNSLSDGSFFRDSAAAPWMTVTFFARPA